jgi:hypothetical protein
MRMMPNAIGWRIEARRRAAYALYECFVREYCDEDEVRPAKCFEEINQQDGELWLEVVQRALDVHDTNAAIQAMYSVARPARAPEEVRDVEEAKSEEAGSETAPADR